VVSKGVRSIFAIGVFVFDLEWFEIATKVRVLKLGRRKFSLQVEEGEARKGNRALFSLVLRAVEPRRRGRAP
jgi:hypothetical protein